MRIQTALLAGLLVGVLPACRYFDDPEGDTGSSGGGATSSFTVTLTIVGDDEGQVPFAVVFQASGPARVDRWEWDFDGNGTVDRTSTSSSVSHTYTVEGDYMPTVRGYDSATNEFGEARVPVTVYGQIVAHLTANPPEGLRPLTVQFTMSATTTTTAIDGWRMDFDGDGTFDTGWLPHPEPQIHQYNDAGTFSPVLEVRGFNGEVGDTSVDVHVRNPPPTASITVVPSNGPAPLDTNINVQASSQNGPITLVRIFPGDGTGTIDLPGPGSVQHTYQAAGMYPLAVLVRDQAGEETVVRAPDLDVFVGESGAPTADLQASPSSGAAPLMTNLDPSGSSDDGQIVLYEYDFEYDGSTFDVEHSETTPVQVPHTYNTEGLHYAALRVTDDEGKASIDAVEIEVVLNVSLAVLDDTFDPYSAMSTTPEARVQTTLSADTDVRVVVKDASRVHVRTLFEGMRAAGMYEDVWDGKDDAGMYVPDEDYYAYLQYMSGGQWLEIPDGASSSSFDIITGTEVPTNGGGFDPWDDEFWRLSFSTNSVGASRITLGISPFTNATVVRTIFLNDVFGTGDHLAWWDGVQDDGTFVPSGLGNGGDFLWSARAWPLADNAIVLVGGRPTIETPRADPNLFYPGVTACFDDGLQVEFETKRDVDRFDGRVYDLDDGSLVDVFQAPGSPAGTHRVVWDGRQLSGEYAPEGRYRVEVTAHSGVNASRPRSVLCVLAF